MNYFENLASCDQAARDHYIAQINELFREITKRWFEISELLKDAKDSLSSTRFIELCDHFDFGEKNGLKLIQISKDVRITPYSDRLISTQSWTPLYEVTQLNQFDFPRFENNVLKRDPIPKITVPMVKGYRISPQVRGDFHPCFSVQASWFDGLDDDERDFLVQSTKELEARLGNKIKVKRDKIHFPFAVFPKDEKRADEQMSVQ